jgi:YgiT-type zinc finger domain-containing protein
MTDLMKLPCSECGGRLRRQAIEQEFEKEGITVKLSGVKAWVCEQCGEIYFAPGGQRKLHKLCKVYSSWLSPKSSIKED